MHDLPEEFRASVFDQSKNIREPRLSVRVDYVDDSDTNRRSRIFRWYDFKTSVFRRFDPPDPDQEYED